jgi:hypothetical protein
MTGTDDTAAYRIEGDLVVPTADAAGPWFGGQQHGGAVMAILTRFLDRVPSAVPMRFTRITVDMSRPAPMRACTVDARAVRDGRRVQGLEAQMRCDDVVVARAMATRIRVEPGLVPDELVSPPFPGDEAPGLAEGDAPWPDLGGGYHRCLEARRWAGPDGLRSRTWLRLVHPIVAGERPSAVVGLAAVADFVSSSSARLGPEWISINPELSLQIEREPIGEWLCVDTTTRLGNDGVGMSEAVVFDTSGRVGRTAKSVLNMRRD